ncbi:hypothetical protein PIB30_076075 [Stylosanthes scabra]|uniref:Uncharacterized protein n=1 Tax=Stylosanthes scabra TaxID=79078 RepID=A0ABU6YNB1_9FABA|nr:hypothetical protein [Stylosanthes scabra]
MADKSPPQVDKTPKKKDKEEKGKQECSEKFSISHQALKAQSSSLNWANNMNQAVIKDVSSKTFYEDKLQFKARCSRSKLQFKVSPRTSTRATTRGPNQSPMGPHGDA